MTIASPVGTVHEWTFLPTDTLLDGVSLGVGAITTWTVPFHDGDAKITCDGAPGGSWLLWYTGGDGGGLTGYHAMPAGTTLTIAAGVPGGDSPGGAGGSGGGYDGGAGGSSGGGGGGASSITLPSGLLMIAGGGGGGGTYSLLRPPQKAGGGGLGHAAGTNAPGTAGKGGTLSAGGAAGGSGSPGTAGDGGAGNGGGGGGGGGLYGGGGGGGSFDQGGGGGSSWADGSVTGVGATTGRPVLSPGRVIIKLDYLGDWVDRRNGWAVGRLAW